MKGKMNKRLVLTTIANIYREASFTSEMITQAVMWEQLEVLDSHLNWLKIRQWDSYEGWIHKFYTTDYFYTNHPKFIVENRREYLYSSPNRKGEISGEVVFGTELPKILEDKNNWFQVLLPNQSVVWIQIEKQTKQSTREQIALNSKKMLGLPYLWGGKFSLGFDCSGFVQTIFKNSGILLHRDSNQQLKTSDLTDIQFELAQKGDLVFFAENKDINHIAIVLGNGKIIHASGEVKIELLKENSKLKNMMIATKSIDKLINQND